MSEDKVNPQKAEAAIESLISAPSELMRAITRVSLKLRLILTTDQWRELEKRAAEPPPPREETPRRKTDRGENPRSPSPPPDKEGQDS